jgi:hypothetical protein
VHIEVHHLLLVLGVIIQLFATGVVQRRDQSTFCGCRWAPNWQSDVTIEVLGFPVIPRQPELQHATPWLHDHMPSLLIIHVSSNLTHVKINLFAAAHLDLVFCIVHA